MGEKNAAADKLLENECKDLGVSADELALYTLPPKDKVDLARAGGVVGPGHRNTVVEDAAAVDAAASAVAGESGDGGDAGDAGDAGEGGEGDQELQPVTEVVMDEVVRFIKKKVGQAARKTAKLAKKYYKKHKGALKRGVKKWKKSAAGKKWMKRYSKVKKKLGGLLGKLKGKKRLHIAGMDLDGRLREELSEGKGDGKGDDDLEILETGAVIAAIIGDHLEDVGLEDDAEAARKTSDNLMALVDKHETEGKFSVQDEDMVPAIKSVGVVIDHVERIADGEAGPLTP